MEEDDDSKANDNEKMRTLKPQFSSSRLGDFPSKNLSRSFNNGDSLSLPRQVVGHKLWCVYTAFHKGKFCLLICLKCMKGWRHYKREQS